MVKRINVLTKRLVNRNATIVQQTQDIVKKQQLLVDIRAILQRSPGLETPEEKTYYEELYKAKLEEFHALKTDLHLSEQQTLYYRGQVNLLNERMKKIKDLYFKQMEKASIASAAKNRYVKSQCLRPSEIKAIVECGRPSTLDVGTTGNQVLKNMFQTPYEDNAPSVPHNSSDSADEQKWSPDESEEVTEKFFGMARRSIERQNVVSLPTIEE